MQDRGSLIASEHGQKHSVETVQKLIVKTNQETKLNQSKVFDHRRIGQMFDAEAGLRSSLGKALRVAEGV